MNPPPGRSDPERFPSSEMLAACKILGMPLAKHRRGEAPTHLAIHRVDYRHISRQH